MENSQEIAFASAYVVALLLVISFFVIGYIKDKIIKHKSFWIYGTCNDRIARKHSIKNNVQFVLWKKGQQGHKEDFWHDFGSGWGELFQPDIK